MFGLNWLRQRRKEKLRAKVGEELAEAEYEEKLHERQKTTLKSGQTVKVKADGRLGCIRCRNRPSDPAVKLTYLGNRALARKKALTSLMSRTSFDVRVADPKAEDGYRIIELYEWELEPTPNSPNTDSENPNPESPSGDE